MLLDYIRVYPSGAYACFKIYCVEKLGFQFADGMGRELQIELFAELVVIF